MFNIIYFFNRLTYMVTWVAHPPKKFNRFKRLMLRDPHRAPVDIVMEVYDCKKTTAYSIAAQNVKKMGLSLKDLMDRMGFSDEEDLKKLKELQAAKKVVTATYEGQITDEREYDDGHLQLKATELSLKLKGHLWPPNNRVDADGDTYNTLVVNLLQDSNVQDIFEVLKALKNRTHGKPDQKSAEKDAPAR